MRLRNWNPRYETLKYIERVCRAVSILINVIFGGREGQTLSARNWHLKKQGLPNWVWLIDRIFFLSPKHCQMSWSWWAAGVQGQAALKEERMAKSSSKKYDEHLKNVAKLL